ncbi:MAG: alpha/beta hydrolase domain-containing protein [Acidimicrobiales bacterium]
MRRAHPHTLPSCARPTVVYRWSAPAIALVLLAGACSGGGSGSEAIADSTTTIADATTTVAPTPTVTTTTTMPVRGDAVAVATVEGPVTGGDRGGLPANPAPREVLDEYGYVEEEFFISGEATSYAPVGELGQDGMWEVEPAATAPFTTRILVRRPADPTDANGVVGIEWLNVSGGQDADPDFGFLYPELMGRGTTWVGVSAQFSGVDGPGIGIPIPGVTATPIKTADPTRYAPIEHPGDDFSYDIFSQAAQAIRRPDGADPLGGVQPEHVIALGESQSAGRLTTYINGVHPLADIYDGFLVHSRLGGAALAAGASGPAVLNFRTDLADPILWFQTETDVARAFAARQPDTDLLVTWEVAGAAHADISQLVWGNASGREIEPDRVLPDFTELCGPINEGPQPVVLRRAWSDLVAWVVDGTPPAAAPELEIVDGRIARDELGIALGGIRTPDVDVPRAVHTGESRPGASVICSLFGSTTPLDAEVLAARYPTHEDYVTQVRESAQAAADAGFLLPEGVEQLVAEADAAAVPA